MADSHDDFRDIPEPVRARPRPIKWCRDCWDNAWVKLVSVFAAFFTVASLVIVWAGCVVPSTWDTWLDNLNSKGFNMSNPNATFGHRAEMEPLEYFGDGRAELGEFSVRMFDPLTRITMRADFKLEGKTVCEDEQSFQQFMKNNNRFFREQVNVSMRSCDPEELAKQDVDQLQRKLVSRVNRALGQDFLETTEMKDFSLFESVDKSSFVRVEPNNDQDHIVALE